MAAERKTGQQGAYQFWLSLLTLILLPFLIVMLVNTAQFQGLQSEASLEQAVTARHLARGDGFTTNIVRPRSLVFSESFDKHPELVQAPLSVLPAALAIKIGQERDGKPIVLMHMMAWVIAVWLVALCAYACFGAKVAKYAVVLICFSPASLNFAVAADGRIWATPLLLILWTVLATGKRTIATGAVCGLLMGLCMLTDYGLVLPLLLGLVPVMMFADEPPAPAREGAEAPVETPDDEEPPPPPTIVRKLDPKLGLVAVGVALLVCLPWLVRNQNVAGKPFPGLATYDVMRNTSTFPGRSIERIYVEDPNEKISAARYVFSHKRQMVEKLSLGFLTFRQAMGTSTEWPLTGLFLASLFFPVAGRLGRARAALAWVIIWDGLLSAVTNQTFSRAVMWVPLTAVFAAHLVTEGIARWDPAPAKRWFVTWKPQALRQFAGASLVLLIALPGIYPQMFTEKAPDSHPSQANHTFLKEAVPDGRAIITDDPWTVAFYVDRPAIWLPQSDDDLEAVQQIQPGGIEAIYITRKAGRMFPYAKLGRNGQVIQERGDWWAYAQAMPQGYLNYRRVASRTEGESVLFRAPEVPTEAPAGE